MIRGEKKYYEGMLTMSDGSTRLNPIVTVIRKPDDERMVLCRVEKDEELKIHERLLKMALVRYDGVIFDCYEIEVDDDGNITSIWSEVCQHCYEKHPELHNSCSDGGMGACGIKGCDIIGADSDNDDHYYIDMLLDHVEFVPECNT
jgi:hypothetical protein